MFLKRLNGKCQFNKSEAPTGTISNTAAFVLECMEECVKISKTDAYKKNCECP